MVLTIIYASVIFLYFILFFILMRKKDKRRNKSGLLTISKYGSFREVSALIILGSILYAGLILCGSLCYKYSKFAGGIIGTSIIFVFCYILFQAAIAIKYGYIVLRDSSITNACIFKRDTLISYFDIKYYGFCGAIRTSLNFYNAFGLPIFSIFDINDNNSFKVKQILENKSIPPIPDEITQEFKKSKYYRNIKIGDNAFGLAFVCIACIAMTLLTFLLPETTDYLHYDATVTVKNCTIHGGRGGTLYEFTIEEDSNIYCLSNIVESKVKGDPKKILSKGNKLQLKIAYTDDRGRLEVSYIADDEKIYLTVADYEKAHNDNYLTKHIISYTFLSLTIITFTVSICLFIIYNKNKKKYLPK